MLSWAYECVDKAGFFHYTYFLKSIVKNIFLGQGRLTSREDVYFFAMTLLALNHGTCDIIK